MSKKLQLRKYLSGENAGVNSVDNSFVNFISQSSLFKSGDFKNGLEKLILHLVELSDKYGNRVLIQLLLRVTKLKNINYSILSLSSNIGLVFVSVGYYSLNTPILSL